MDFKFLYPLVLEYGGKIALAILTLLIGFRIISATVELLMKGLSKSSEDLTLNNFLRALISTLLKVALFISVAQIVGVETTSFVAVIGAASFAVGLALQGSLANFAGGVLLILFKPFKVGDLIEAQGFLGNVHEVQLFVTILKTLDNRTVFIPNGPLASGSMINYSTEPVRRVDMIFSVTYKADILKVKEVIQKITESDPKIMQEAGKEPFIVVSKLADAVQIEVRVWGKEADYWDIYFGMQENIKLTFDKEGIVFPSPKIDVFSHNVS
ncbi:MAG: mechanosensitive ion channel [Microscillaceae bacterium]|nr:mechanosensitive ion channel [Microscillaceae bacterium]